jgi:hypothetical protein
MTKIGVCAVALMLSLGFSADASATFIMATGTFHENLGVDSTPDDLTITNDGSSDVDITMVVIDLSGSADTAIFDPADATFTVVGVDNTGFDGNFTLNGNQELTLIFTSFDPGDVFSFEVDIDDGNGLTTGADFDGSTFTATFSGVVPTLDVTYLDQGGFDALGSNSFNTPEPGTFSTVSLGLLAIAAARRRRNRA